MNDKYNMTKEQNVFLAKRCIVDSIWKSSHIEGIDVTYPETQRIYDGNKRTAMLFTNKIMIQNGNETNDMSDLKQFIYDKCISGITFPNT